MYMICTTCQHCAPSNNVGICLDCQAGKGGFHALQKRSAKKVDVRQQAKDGQGVASRNTEREETSQEEEKEGFKDLDPELLCNAMVGVIGLQKTKQVLDHYNEVVEYVRVTKDYTND